MADEPKSPGDKIYLVTVLVLLVVIMATLAALWMIERRARRAAAFEAAEFQQRNSRLEGAIRNLVLQQGMGLEIKVNRDDLPAQTVQVDGRPKKAFVLSARTGAKLGFEPGDVVIVSTQPASEPASEPATTHAGEGP